MIEKSSIDGRLRSYLYFKLDARLNVLCVILAEWYGVHSVPNSFDPVGASDLFLLASVWRIGHRRRSEGE